MSILGLFTPPLVKFCPEKFNITNGYCNTIRVGTLYGFRREENEKLRDEGEGEFAYNLQFPNLTKVSNQWIAAFEIDNPIDSYIEHMEFRGPDTYVKGEISLSGSSHNCWIFCVSKKSESTGNISETHESKWFIPSEKIPDFAKYLGNIIWQNVKIDDIPKQILETHSFQELREGLNFQFECRDVTYSDRHIVIEKEEDFPADKMLWTRQNIPFLKPHRFEEESEVRFAFWLTFRGKRISINDNPPKILQLRPVDGLIASQHQIL